jgi:hypothetical protein
MRFNALLSLAFSALLMGAAGNAGANVERTLCIFDIVGASGDTYNLMKDYKAAALNWGVNFKLKVYTDEKIAAEDLKAGVCDAAAITGIRARQFNKYTGSLDSVGALPSYDHVRTVVQVLASGSPTINDNLKSGPYEVAGVGPMGAAYLFVKDRTIDTVNELSGKSIAVMEYDDAQARMARQVGMSPVLSDVTNFAGRFNNNSVDICFAPIAAYSALELYKGMKPNGGIVDYVLGPLTLQLVTRHEKFPQGYAQQSREYFNNQIFDQAMTVVRNARSEVNKKWWINIPEADKARYDQMMRESRMSMTQDGIYDADMMSLLRKIRCKHDSSRAECVNPTE